MTIWELKKIAAKKFNLSPLSIDLKRSTTARTTIGDISNHKFLRDLRLDNYEIIQVMKKPIVSIPRVSLMNKKKTDLVPEAKAIFKSWFESFSTDGYMGKEQCALFIKSTTNTPMSVPTNDDRIIKIFKQYS
jgi:hypothetical protein